NVVALQVNIPDDLRSGCKIVRALLRHITLRFWAIIAFAPDFNGEYGRTFKKFHRDVANVKSCIWAERFAVRKINYKRCVYSDGIAFLPSFGVFAQRKTYLLRCIIRQTSGG